MKSNNDVPEGLSFGVKVPPYNTNWILSNLQNENETPISNSLFEYCVLERASRKIGFIAISEREWGLEFKNMENPL